MDGLPSRREMLEAVDRRDGGYDGVFFFAVRTTGVFCVPSCPSRRPRPENVIFFADAGSAVRAGFRPCRRCRPQALAEGPPSWLRPLLERLQLGSERRLSDRDLRGLGLEPSRVRRYFRRRFGMTFQQFQRQSRLGEALGELRRGTAVTPAGLSSGYASDSGFRSAFSKLFGGSPGRRRDGEVIVTRVCDSPVGPLVLAATRQAVCMVEFGEPARLREQMARLQRVFGLVVVPGGTGHLERLEDQLHAYFAGRRRTFDVPLELRGTPFQRSVWEALQAIPYGETRSYEAIAADIGRPAAQRAVGLANGRNRLAIVVPCHRVVNKGGRLGGYGGGLWRKRQLLELERRVLAAPQTAAHAVR